MYLFSEYLLREGLLDPGEAVGAHGHAHAERGAHELADGRQLPRVEVDGDQQQHLAERRRHFRITAREICLKSNQTVAA